MWHATSHGNLEIADSQSLRFQCFLVQGSLIVQLRCFINGTEVRVVHTNMYKSHRRVQISYKNRVGAFKNHWKVHGWPWWLPRPLCLILLTHGDMNSTHIRPGGFCSKGRVDIPFSHSIHNLGMWRISGNTLPSPTHHGSGSKRQCTWKTPFKGVSLTVSVLQQYLVVDFKKQNRLQDANSQILD